MPLVRNATAAGDPLDCSDDLSLPGEDVPIEVDDPR